MIGVKFSTFALVLVVLAHGSMAMTLGSTGRNMTGVVKAVDALKTACEPSWIKSFPAKLAACVLAVEKTKKPLAVCPQECAAFFASVSDRECKVAVTNGAQFVLPKNYKTLFQVTDFSKKKSPPTLFCQDINSRSMPSSNLPLLLLLLQLCGFGEFSMFSKPKVASWVAVGDPKSSDVASAAIGALSKSCGPSIAAISVPFAACVAATKKQVQTCPKSCQMMLNVVQMVSKNCKIAAVETAIGIVPSSYNNMFLGCVKLF